jgi:mono/diheme cytochrome c family protein
MKRIRPFALLLLVLAAGTAFAGGDSKPVAEEEGDGPNAAKLWAQNCSRCHNLRPAVTYSDAQWDVIAHHMRIRAFLTGKESRAIVQFLKEAN